MFPNEIHKNFTTCFNIGLIQKCNLFVFLRAITIRNSLESGCSEYSPTFDNPPLASTVDFNIEMLEVFGFVEEEA